MIDTYNLLMSAWQARQEAYDRAEAKRSKDYPNVQVLAGVLADATILERKAERLWLAQVKELCPTASVHIEHTMNNRDNAYTINNVLVFQP